MNSQVGNGPALPVKHLLRYQSCSEPCIVATVQASYYSIRQSEATKGNRAQEHPWKVAASYPTASEATGSRYPHTNAFMLSSRVLKTSRIAMIRHYLSTLLFSVAFGTQLSDRFAGGTLQVYAKVC
jgi:cobalamin-dependent methionine synthase I